MEFGVKEPQDDYLTALPAEAQAAVGRQLAALSDAVTQGAMNWGFEVIKHLAILNGAGLAAIVAIAQAANGDPNVHALALHGAHVFVAGLMIACIAMVTVYITGLLFLRRFTQSVIEVTLGVRPLSALKAKPAFLLLIGVNWTLAAASIFLFFVGALKIVSIA